MNSDVPRQQGHIWRVEVMNAKTEIVMTERFARAKEIERHIPSWMLQLMLLCQELRLKTCISSQKLLKRDYYLGRTGIISKI